ncbi:LysM domain-containing protein [Mycolicibacterium moriokaense]|nr:LysM domain-containing protein [Mycolicibacterium moriokaense]
MKNYTVAAGDTLFGIATREYGDGELYPVIARMNDIANPDLIVAGQQLLVPFVTRRHLWTGEDTTAARAQLTQHYYGTLDTKIQLIWEVASGVAQQPIEPGAWLLIPDLGDVGHHTVVDGESFESLAARWYGDDHLAVVIAFANEMDPATEPAPGTVLIQPGLNFAMTIAGHTLESACRFVYGDSELIPTWTGVVAAANFLGAPHQLFAGQTVHFPR